MSRVLITGASGLLGTTLAPALSAAGYEVVRHSRRGAGDVFADLTDRARTRALIDAVRPAAVVNLVALTNVDQCEREPNAAHLLNTRTVEYLVDALRAGHDAFLVQLSTDQVYDSAGPSGEDDVTLTNVYALTKYAGELAAKLVPSAVLRTNFFGRSRLPGRASFSDRVLGALREQRPITGFTDVIVNPLSMPTLSRMICRVLERRTAGIFNLGSSSALSKADLVCEIARAYGLSAAAVTRGTSGEARLAAYRPKDMSMQCGRFETAFGVKLPPLEREIEDLKRDDDGKL